jgi:hypothetical protein
MFAVMSTAFEAFLFPAADFSIHSHSKKISRREVSLMHLPIF